MAAFASVSASADTGTGRTGGTLDGTHDRPGLSSLRLAIDSHPAALEQGRFAATILRAPYN